MAPIANCNVFNFNGVPVEQETPMSRTHQYRKVMKPLLERKRRARINRCLDELKDLMVFALESEGESMAKLEKADVLELTVRHLQKLKRQNMLESNPALNVDRFRSGFSACATEVSRFISNVPGIDMKFGTSLMTHLGNSVTAVGQTAPLSVNTISTSMTHQLPLSPSSDGGYNSGRDSTPSPPVSVGCPSPVHFQREVKEEAAGVWRPF